MPEIFKLYAPHYAQEGWHVFPISPNSKVPFKGSKGLLDATVDNEIVMSWQALYPDANVGISCGPSGILVLDADVKKNGLESLDSLIREIPEIKSAWIARTGSGGYHYYFQSSAEIEVRNDQSRLGPGLDIRGCGGYVVAPPSINENGAYEWLSCEGPLPAVPEALLNKIQASKPPILVGVQLEDDNWMIPPGERHDRFLRMAGAMRAQGMTSEAILDALRATNAAQCVPLHEDADIVRIARDYGKKEVLPQVAAKMQRKKEFNFVPMSTVKRENIDWLWHGRISYGRMTLLVGEPGKTKSYLTCKIAAHVSNGQPLPDDNINLPMSMNPHGVVMLTYEDGLGDTIRPRLDKCGADLSRIYTLPMDHEGFSIEDVPALEAAITKLPDIRLIIIDPMQNIVGGVDDHNDSKLRVALNPLIKLAFRKNIAILGIKHLNKDESRSINNRIGGSIGYGGMARNVLFAGWDNDNPFGPKGEVNSAVIVTKGNLAAYKQAVTYTVHDHGLDFTGVDPTIGPDRLVTKSPKGNSTP